MTLADNNEWTFVTRKTKTQRQQPQGHPTTHENVNTHKNPNSKRSQIKRERQVAQAIHLQSSILSHDDNNGHIMEDSLEAMIAIIEKCKIEMKSLGHKQQSCSTLKCSHIAFFDMATIMDSIKQASSTSVHDNHDYDANSRQVREIICYGIGNFSHARSHNYNAPLIQLVCVLLLRDMFAVAQKEGTPRCSNEKQDETIMEKSNLQQSSSSPSLSLSNNYSTQQELVPLYYFEPLIKPLEVQVLKHYHVKILDVNQQGKHSIHYENTKGKHQEESDFFTLFYMPHCPMRLYSNVLWANWNQDLIWNKRIIIFGNSFKAYDDRIISSRKIHDDTTNAIFPLLPYLSEIPVLLSTQVAFKRKNNAKRWCPECMGRNHTVLTERDLELSFNDCAIISFNKYRRGQMHNGKDVQFPSRPEEYQPDKDGEGQEGELL